MTTRGRVLVTGSTGFVGTHLTPQLLDDGWAVHRLLQAGLEVPSPVPSLGVTDHVWQGTTETAVPILAEVRPDVVIHLAAMFRASHEVTDIEPLVNANLLVGLQVVDAATRAGCTAFVNAGTSWQNYRDDAYDPVCLYAATKQAFEDLLAYYVKACGLHVVTLKLYDTYGPGDHRAKLFNALRRASEGGEQLAMSPGEQELDLVYVSDVTRAFSVAASRACAAGAPGAECYAVSSGVRSSLRQVVGTYEAATGRSVPVEWGGRPYPRGLLCGACRSSP